MSCVCALPHPLGLTTANKSSNFGKHCSVHSNYSIQTETVTQVKPALAACVIGSMSFSWSSFTTLYLALLTMGLCQRWMILTFKYNLLPEKERKRKKEGDGGKEDGEKKDRVVFDGQK